MMLRHTKAFLLLKTKFLFVIVTAGICKAHGVSRTFDEAGVCQLGGLFLSPLQNSFP